MKILARHKDLNNIVFGYTIENENGQQFLERDALLSYVGIVEIENAYLTKDKDFKAKDGYHIKTIKEKCNKAVAHTNNGYYGEGMLEACKRIRKLTSENKVIINRTIEEVNIHLARVLNDCGLTTETFIKNYLSVIQPYMLSKEYNNMYTCHIGFKLGLKIKIESTQIIVESFNDTIIKAQLNDRPCMLITDDAYKSNELYYSIRFTINIMGRNYSYETVTRDCKNGIALVEHYNITRKFDENIYKAFNKLKIEYRKKEDPKNVSLISIIDPDGKLFSEFEIVGSQKNSCILVDAYEEATANKEKTILINILIEILSSLTKLDKKEEKATLVNNCKIKNNMYNLILSIL